MNIRYVFLLLLMSGNVPDSFAQSSPAKTPDQILDLHHWSLTIPVNAGGGMEGKPLTIQPEGLLNGYHSPYFYVSTDGGVTFWSPSMGTTTLNAQHPRSELRELIDPHSNKVNWYDTLPSRMDAVLSVNQVPSEGHTIVIGQIHGEGKVPMLLLFYTYDPVTRTGSIRAGLHDAADVNKQDYVLASGIGLNQHFSYHIEVGADNSLRLAVNDAPPTLLTIDTSWRGIGLYFKAGVYVQTNAHANSTPDDGGKVTFYKLEVRHA